MEDDWRAATISFHSDEKTNTGPISRLRHILGKDAARHARSERRGKRATPK